MSRSLKFFLIGCGLMLVVAAATGWQTRQRLDLARERNARMVSEAVALGIAVVSADKKSSTVLTKRARDTAAEQAKLELEEIWPMLLAVDAAAKKEGTDLEDGAEQVLQRMMSLSPAGVELVLRALIDDTSLDRDDREGLMGVLLTKLAHDSPRALLDLLPELGGIVGDKEDYKRTLEIFAADALGSWGKKDPVAAVAWIRSHGAGFSGSLDEGVKQRILTGAASRDPGMAFGLLGEMEIKDRQKALASIVRGANGAEGRAAALAALRTHLASGDGGGNEEILNTGIGQLAEKSFREGFGPASKWLGEAGFSPAEMTTVGARLEYYHTISETGKWLDWLGQSLPADKAGEPVGRIMKRWTEVDYRAAGEWLAAAPEGPARSASIRTYAGMISAHEPETAVKWAMLLPAGEERDDTFKQIHQNWPKEQEAARDAFAKEHGIE